MTYFVDGATVVHLVAHLDHKHAEAESVCGEDGELVEQDGSEMDETEICRRCRQQSPHFDVEDEDDDEEAEDGE